MLGRHPQIREDLDPINNPSYLGTTIFVSALCGGYTVLSGHAIYVLLSRTHAPRTSRVLAVVVGGLYLSTVIYWAVTINVTTVWYVNRRYEDVPYPSQLVQCAPTASLVVNTILSDGIVWWRAWAIWNRSWTVLRSAVVFLLATFAFSVVTARHACSGPVDQYGLNGPGELFTSDRYGAAAAGLTMLTNMIATGLIGVKAWRHRQFIRDYLSGSSGRTRAEEVLLLLIESSAVYCVLWIYVFVGILGSAVDLSFTTPSQRDIGVHNANEAYVAVFQYGIQGLVPMIGIYPTIVVLLVSRQRKRYDSHPLRPDEPPSPAVSLPRVIHIASIMTAQGPADGAGRDTGPRHLGVAPARFRPSLERKAADVLVPAPLLVRSACVGRERTAANHT